MTANRLTYFQANLQRQLPIDDNDDDGEDAVAAYFDVGDVRRPLKMFQPALATWATGIIRYPFEQMFVEAIHSRWPLCTDLMPIG